MTTAKDIEARLDCPEIKNREKTVVQQKSFKVKDLLAHIRHEDPSVETNKKTYMQG